MLIPKTLKPKKKRGRVGLPEGTTMGRRKRFFLLSSLVMKKNDNENEKQQ